MNDTCASTAIYPLLSYHIHPDSSQLTGWATSQARPDPWKHLYIAASQAAVCKGWLISTTYEISKHNMAYMCTKLKTSISFALSIFHAWLWPCCRVPPKHPPSWLCLPLFVYHPHFHIFWRHGSYPSWCEAEARNNNDSYSRKSDIYTVGFKLWH